MKKLTPEEFQEKLQAQIKNLESLKSMQVKVGIISNGAGAGVYGDGQTALDIGLKHEYGTEDIPRRSFLRAPFFAKQKEIV